MKNNVIPFPNIPADQIVHCQDCGRPATCCSPNHTPLCDGCAEGSAGWCQLCEERQAVALSSTPSIPEGTDEPWALCASCWH